MSEFWGEKKIIKWADIAKGVGEIVLHSVFRMPHQLASHGNHFLPDGSELKEIPANYYDGDLPSEF